MANKLSKTRPIDKPYAIYEGHGFTWHILKTYKTPASEKKDRYARWFTAAKSAMSYDEFEYGDAYTLDIKMNGRLVWASEAWIDQYGL